MAKFLIQGGYQLEGEINISGMKNAATPIIAASLLTKEKSLLHNVPRISDVLKMLEILSFLGAKVTWVDKHSVEIDPENLVLKDLTSDLVGTMRSSILFFGALLGRFGQAKIAEPGGCLIGNRPLDTHFYALQEMGASLSFEENLYSLKAEKLKGKTIVLPEFSVTATENVLMAAATLEEKTILKTAAAEPHVQDLISFLQKMGVQIEGKGTHTLEIFGSKKLKGVEHTIIPDQIEIGTFAIAGALAAKELLIKPVIPEHLDLILLTLKKAGVKMNLDNDQLVVYGSKNLKAFRVQSLPYPGFPTDLQAPFALLATQCQGMSLIHDPLYEGRMSYVGELVKMGANALIADPHRVIVSGPTPLFGRKIKSFDLRAGATLILAGLIAQGETEINEAEIVDRGYEQIEERLSQIGAKIKRIS